MNKTISLIITLFIFIYPLKASFTQTKITHYNISIKLPETYDHLEIESQLSLSFEKSDKDVQLPIGIGNGFKGAKISHLKVMNLKGEPIPFKQDSHIINIHFQKEIAESKKEIIIAYHLQKDNTKGQGNSFAFEISDTLCHINAAITRTDNWYPRIDGTYDERLPEYDLWIETNSKMETMCSGKLKYVKENGSRKIFHSSNYEGLADRSLFFFIAPLKKIEKTFPDGFQIIAYIPANALDSSVTHITEVIYRSCNYFEKTFGEVPGNEYRVMAFPYGHSGLFNAMTAPMNLFTQPIRNNEIYFPSRGLIHEVSHTWWGNAVSANATDHYWLYEGFAKYSEILGIKEVLKVDVEKLSYIRLKYSILPYHDQMPSVTEGGKEDIRALETASAYYYGAMVLKMMEQAIGKDKFLELIKKYVKEYYGKTITTEKFLEFMKVNVSEKTYHLLNDHISIPDFGRYSIEIKNSEKENIHYSVIVTNTGKKNIFTVYKIENKLDTLWLGSGKSKTFEVNAQFADSFVPFTIDPDTIFPVWENDLSSGGAMIFSNPKKEVIFYGVVQGNPFANAGISDNTVLMQVNGQSTEGKTFEQLNQMLFYPSGKSLKLLIKKPKQENTEEIIVTYGG